jgi:phenylalanyl-tRNA synthetase beta subunit
LCVEVPRAVHQNDIFEVIREVAGDLVEKVSLFDEFFNKKTGTFSQRQMKPFVKLVVGCVCI